LDTNIEGKICINATFRKVARRKGRERRKLKKRGQRESMEWGGAYGAGKGEGKY